MMWDRYRPAIRIADPQWSEEVEFHALPMIASVASLPTVAIPAPDALAVLHAAGVRSGSRPAL
jgi:hypothetical protein